MPHKLKFHLIAVLLIVLVVSVVHSFIAPAPSAPRIVQVVQFTPTIVQATWGRNCNTRIEQTLLQQPQRYEARPVMPDDSAPQQKPLALVAANNVLSTLQKLCAEQPDPSKCVFTPNTATLGEILPGCNNQLEVQFYCSQTERVRMMTFSQGQTVTLDCSGTRR